MKTTEPLQRPVLARKKCRPLELVALALQMAMAGLMLTLLIVMMLIEGTTPIHGFPLDRAATKHPTPMPGAKREDAIKILLTRDGAIYFGHRATQVEDLADQIRQKVRDGSERRVYLMVDARTKYWDVENAVDAIRGSGIWNVALLVEQDQRATTQP
jgi:biopolymer transport protein ExbD